MNERVHESRYHKDYSESLKKIRRDGFTCCHLLKTLSQIYLSIAFSGVALIAALSHDISGMVE